MPNIYIHDKQSCVSVIKSSEGGTEGWSFIWWAVSPVDGALVFAFVSKEPINHFSSVQTKEKWGTLVVFCPYTLQYLVHSHELE